MEVERNINTVAEDRHNRKKGVIVVELDQFRYKISRLEKPMEQIKKSLDLENKKKRIEELEADMEAPGFWDNTEKSQHAMKELKTLKSSFEKYNELEQGLEDAKTLIEMADEENDASLIPEVENEINSFEEKLEKINSNSSEAKWLEALRRQMSGLNLTEQGKIIDGRVADALLSGTETQRINTFKNQGIYISSPIERHCSLCSR